MGQVTYFLGHKFQWKIYRDSANTHHLKVHLSQKAFVEQLVHTAKLDTSTNNPEIPYRSGYPMDSLPEPKSQEPPNQDLITKLQNLVESLIWLSQGTRPDLATITAMIARYQNNPTEGHLDANGHDHSTAP